MSSTHIWPGFTRHWSHTTDLFSLLCQGTLSFYCKMKWLLFSFWNLLNHSFNWTVPFFLFCYIDTSLFLPGWPAFSEGGECPASPQYQESHSSAPAQQLWAQLLATPAVWRGALNLTENRNELTVLKNLLYCWNTNVVVLNWMLCTYRTIFHQQRFPSGLTTGWWSGCGLRIWLNTLPTWEAAVCMAAWWWDGHVFGPPRKHRFSPENILP